MNFRPTLVIIDTHMSVSILLVATDRNPTLISLNISYKGKNHKQKKENIMMYLTVTFKVLSHSHQEWLDSRTQIMAFGSVFFYRWFILKHSSHPSLGSPTTKS